jgi:hypothetical protein
MNAILERMPAGVPGDVSRKQNATLEPNLVGNIPIPFGAPVKLVSGKLAPLAGGESAAAVYGFLARAYPIGSIDDAQGRACACPDSAQDVLRRGYMTLKLAQGVAAKNGVVYVRLTADTGKAPGDIEAAGGTGLVAVPAVFMGPADAGGNVEIAYNI